jgi:hypothetical protein
MTGQDTDRSNAINITPKSYSVHPSLKNQAYRVLIEIMAVTSGGCGNNWIRLQP